MENERTPEELKREILARIKYQYFKIDMTYNFPNSYEGDVLKMVHKLLTMEK